MSRHPDNLAERRASSYLLPRVRQFVYANLLPHARPGGGDPIRRLSVDAPLVRRAASFNALGGIGYADCFAAAAATLDCSVLSGDPEFRIVERTGITVQWL